MKDKGITLISLVVTIVVLLILAGVTIGTLTSDNGVIKEATTAKEKAEKAGVEEQIEMAILKVGKKYTNPTLDNIIDQMKEDGIINSTDDVNKVTGKIITTSGYEIEGKLDDYIEISPNGLGDINDDGNINNEDEEIIMKYATRMITLTEDQKLRADVNKDGKINVKDAQDLNKYIKKQGTE